MRFSLPSPSSRLKLPVMDSSRSGLAQVDHTHHICDGAPRWPRGFGKLNPNPHSLIFTSVSFSRFQSSLAVIQFRYAPNTCWHRTYPICDVPLSRSARRCLNWLKKWGLNPWPFIHYVHYVSTESLSGIPGGGGTPYNGLHKDAQPERGTFFKLQACERVRILLVKVHKRVGKTVT